MCRLSDQLTIHPEHGAGYAVMLGILCMGWDIGTWQLIIIPTMTQVLFKCNIVLAFLMLRVRHEGLCPAECPWVVCRSAVMFGAGAL